MAHPSQKPVLRLSALPLAASVLALAAAAALADTAPVASLAIAPLSIAPRSQVPAGVAATDTLLKRLPAGTEDLTFRGELTSRRFPVVLGRGEASRIDTFQVALRNAVSTLPERSAVTVAINGRTLATLPADAADKTVVLPVTVPPGLLVPGPNIVQVTATLTHRVDCSVPATYELWATLDPARSGFVVPRGAAETLNGVADLAAVPLAQDGTTHIRVRMPDAADEAEVAQAARAVQALVQRARLVRPVVEVGAEPGTGPGFDLLPKGYEPADLSVPAATDGIAFRQDEATGRITVVVDPDVEAAPRSGVVGYGGTEGVQPVRNGFRKSFADLGQTTEVFTGRRYEARFPVVLPSDFTSSNDRALLRIDGGHSATLVEGDGLTMRVNGTLVSTLPLAAGKAERFDHREVELPLRFFHPGQNVVTIEGTLSAEADAQCRTTTMPREARLTIADTSEFDFPDFAHLVTIPQIPAALAAKGDLPVYLPASDCASLEAAFTVLASMAAQGGSAMTPRVHLGAVNEAAPGLVVAAADQLPDTLSGALRTITRPAAQPVDAAAPEAMDAKAQAEEPRKLDAGASRLVAAADQVRGAFRSRGFFFGSDRADALSLKSADLLIAAVVPGGKAPRSTFDIMPRFTQDPTHWLVVTAGDAPSLDAGLHQLVSSGRWNALRGEAARFDPTDGTLDVRQPRNVTYVLSSGVAVADMRPILGGLMSDNILMSLVILFVVMGALGISTHALVRRMGVK